MSTTMHFVPEWMRTKNQPPARSQAPPSPPPTSSLPSSTSLSTYSALVSVAPPVNSNKLDEAHPFRYSKEELLNIYQGNGWKGELGLEVERWEGVVREVAADPVTLLEMTEMEKKLFAGSLNSEIRRRPSQSTDYMSPLHTSGLERPRMMHSASASTSTPLRERFAMKRRDSAGRAADLSNSIPRKPPLSTLQVPPLHSPREVTSPRTRHTSNFDGILNNGETWIARRSFSEASMKGATLPRDGQVEEQSPKGRGIREEEENGTASQFTVDMDEPPCVPSSTTSGQGTGAAPKDPTDVPNLGSSAMTNQPEIEKPLAFTDLAAVEWSYKDPSGQIQGPFRADLMQKWYIDGYFTPDLPMKRTYLDTQWTTVQELVRHTASGNVFLAPPPPPGLDRQSPLRNYPTAEHTVPFQPAPIRSLRTSTLESYLTGGSMASDSPSSSSLGASQMGNSSPEPSVLGGRENRMYINNDINVRTTDFGLPDHSSTFIGNHLSEHDFVQDLRGKLQGPSFGNLASGVDTNGPGCNHSVPQDPWNLSSSFQSSSFTMGGTNPNSPHTGPPVGFMHEAVAMGYGLNTTTGHIPDYSNQQSRSMALSSHVANSYEFATNTPFATAPTYPPSIVDYTHSQQPVHNFGLRALDPLGSQGSHPLINSDVSSGSWHFGLPDAVTNERAADLAHLPTLPPKEHMNGEAVHDATVQSEPISNEGTLQYGKEQDLIETLDQKLVIVERDSQTGSAINIAETSHQPIIPEAVKSNMVLDDQSSASEQAPSSEPSAPAPPRSAWTKDDDSRKKKGPSASISLRAIQEAEAKRLENIKAAEREKEKGRMITTSFETKEDLQPFTTSWGLPTSQAGVRHNVSLSVPPPSVPAVTTPAPPIWTTPLKTSVVKKSMKEIQEEEKRKKQSVKDSAPVSVQRRAYAETTTKTVPTITSNNNPWTTVGPNGKATAPTSSGRSSVSTSFPPVTSGATRSSLPSTQKPTPSSTSKIRPMPTKYDEIPNNASHEFLKWLGDALKGLNHSVNVEEIMSMLLSFPVDADSSTLEIISDTIYANSTTLDGRRFAAEFVAKRKADAGARSKGTLEAGKGLARPVSIADVVKAVPKPTQPEWGFKVVNKKKKGGRS